MKNTKDIKEKNERRIRFNVIDLLIILFIIAAVAGIFIRYNLADQLYLNARGEEFEIEFLIENIQEESQRYLQPGTPFYITNENTELGKVKEILDIREAVNYIADMYGNLGRVELPGGRIDVTGIMTCYGRTTKEGYMINGNAFAAVNKQYLVKTGELMVNITIMDIKKVN